MNPFKVEDIVTCIDNDRGSYKKLIIGKVYYIIAVNGKWVNIKDDDGTIQEGWDCGRFELVKEVKEVSTPVQKNERAVSDWGF